MGDFKFLTPSNTGPSKNIKLIVKVWEVSGFLKGLQEEDKITVSLALQELASQIIDSGDSGFDSFHFRILFGLLKEYDFKIDINEIYDFISIFRIDLNRSIADYEEYYGAILDDDNAFSVQDFMKAFINTYDILPQFLA